MAPTSTRLDDRDVQLLHALADPTRLAIVRQLSGADQVCACDFTDCCDVRQPTVSHHLKVLRDAGVVVSERRGTNIYYQLAPDAAVHLGAEVELALDGPMMVVSAAKVKAAVARTQIRATTTARGKSAASRTAMLIPSVAHSALEYHRWFLRSWLRTDGIRYAHRMRAPIGVPTLHLHGAMDPCVPTRSAQASARYVDGPYRWRLLEGAGHFLPEEQPDRFDSALHNWLADPEPER